MTGGPAGSIADWRTHIWVDDADATAAKVTESGGTVDAFTDPTGAGLRVWQAGTHRGAKVVNAAGSWNWSDLNTDELDQARDFYAAVFGWEATAVDFGCTRATRRTMSSPDLRAPAPTRLKWS